MNQVIIIHGMPSKEEYFDDSLPKPENAHWIPWIKEKLKEKNFEVKAPAMPKPYDPKYNLWVSEFEKLTVNENTILVGHSCGGGFLLRYFSEHPEINPKKIILVAPWIDPEPHILDSENNFFNFNIDETIVNRTGLSIFYSLDDSETDLNSSLVIKKTIPYAKYYCFEDKGHFTEGDLGTKEFPELLEEILN